MIKSIIINRHSVRILDQTLLPHKEIYLVITDYRKLISAIKQLKVRGAPLIGIAATATMYLSTLTEKKLRDYKSYFEKILEEIEQSRPTAVNLFKSTRYLRTLLGSSADFAEYKEQVKEYLHASVAQEAEVCQTMSEKGVEHIKTLFPGKTEYSILTHCNTGSLATFGSGTALGVIKELSKSAKIHVYVDETRPLLQGSRLTAWELDKENIPFTIISDNMAAHVMKERGVDFVITGADRIARNGDSANKIGTYNLAVLAKYHNIPFLIIAPESTIDRNINDGTEIPIEIRKSTEVLKIGSKSITKTDFPAYNPAFDVTPHKLIKAIITEKKVYSEPYKIDN